MSIGNGTLLSILFWIVGYFQTKFPFESSLIKVPKFLFYICGAPKTKEFPNSVMTSRGFAFQIVSFFLLAFIYIDGQWLNLDKYASGVLGIFGSLIIGYLIALLISKLNPFIQDQ